MTYSPSQVKRDAMRKMNRQSCQVDRRQTRSQTVREKKKEQEQEELIYEARKTDHIDCDFSFARCLYPRNLPWSPTLCHLRQLLLLMNTSCLMVMRMTTRIKLTLLNLTIEHLNVLTMAKDCVMVMLNYNCVPNAQDLTD